MKLITWMGVSWIAMALSAQATLTHTNGNFDAGAAAGDNSNVPDWFDGNNHPGGNWEDTWLNTIHQPSGQSGGTVGFSGNVPTATNFLYQPIGTRNPGDGTLYFSISVGAFTDGWGLRSGTLHVGLYEQTGSFTGSDGTDIDGSDGVTQVGSTVALSISRVGGWVASDETGSFDISGVSTSNTLYLRYQWIPTDGSYISVDNASVSTVAPPSLKLTNGNFDAGAAAGDNSNVPDWFDGNHHPNGPWEDTWLNTINIPSGQSGGTVGFSGNIPTATNFLYQSIGTRNPGDSTLHFSISVGAFTDGEGIRSGTLHVGLYEQTGSFTGADGIDIDGADGMTQVGSTVALPISRVGGPGAVASDETGSFDISGVSTSNTLYLRFQWIPTDGSYMSVDNASITVSQGVTYATWASNNGVAGNPDEDSDNDGVSNGMEYFMGIASSDPVFTVSPGVGLANNISWPMSATFAGTYEVETSPDLRTWTPVNPKPTPVGGYLTYTVQSGAEGGKSFVRLAVTPD